MTLITTLALIALWFGLAKLFGYAGLIVAFLVTVGVAGAFDDGWRGSPWD